MYGSKHEEIRHARKEMTSNKKITLIKNQEGLKIKLFPVYNKSQKQTQIGLNYYAKMALKERIETAAGLKQ